MENDYNTTEFLARWVDKTLTEEERRAFEQTEIYQEYQAILKGTDVLEVPEYDKNNLFEKVQHNKKGNNKVISLIPKWVYAAAASVVLFLGYTFFFKNTVTHSTDFGQQLAITLPDNSQVRLNAKSTLSYNKKEWKNNRTLNLEGEAYFKVVKGSTFTVTTQQGKISVLGTKFVVNVDDSFFEVICYEGKVRVENDETSKILTQGEALRLVQTQFENWELNDTGPSWLQEKSTFTNTPLSQVIKALEKQYNVKIDASKIDVDRLRYTGGFTHNNLEKALQTVFAPLKIKFTFIQKNRIVLSDQL